MVNDGKKAGMVKLVGIPTKVILRNGERAKLSIHPMWVHVVLYLHLEQNFDLIFSFIILGKPL